MSHSKYQFDHLNDNFENGNGFVSGVENWDDDFGDCDLPKTPTTNKLKFSVSHPKKGVSPLRNIENNSIKQMSGGVSNHQTTISQPNLLNTKHDIWDNDFNQSGSPSQLNRSTEYSKIDSSPIKSSPKTKRTTSMTENWDLDFVDSFPQQNTQPEITAPSKLNKQIIDDSNDNWDDYDFTLPLSPRKKIDKHRGSKLINDNKDNWDDDFDAFDQPSSCKKNIIVTELSDKRITKLKKKLSPRKAVHDSTDTKANGDNNENWDDDFLSKPRKSLKTPRKRGNSKKITQKDDNWDDFFTDDTPDKSNKPLIETKLVPSKHIVKQPSEDNWDTDFSDVDTTTVQSSDTNWDDNFGGLSGLDTPSPAQKLTGVSVTSEEVWDDDFSVGGDLSFQPTTIQETGLMQAKLPFLKQVKDIVDHFPNNFMNSLVYLCDEDITDSTTRRLAREWENACDAAINKDYLKASKLYLPLVTECLVPTLPVSDLFKLRVFFQAFTIHTLLKDEAKSNQMLELAYTVYSSIFDPPNDPSFSFISGLLNNAMYDLYKNDESFTPKVNRLIDGLSFLLFPIRPFNSFPNYVYPWKIIGELAAALTYELEFYECTCDGITDVLTTKVRLINSMFSSMKTTQLLIDYDELVMKNTEKKENKLKETQQKSTQKEMIEEEEEDWDLEFGITTQLGTTNTNVFETLQEEIVEENPPEACRLIEIVNDESEHEITIPLPSTFMDIEQFQQTFKGNELQQFFLETTEIIKTQQLIEVMELPENDKLDESLMEYIYKNKDLSTMLLVSLKIENYMQRIKQKDYDCSTIVFVTSELLRMYSEFNSINTIELLEMVAVCFCFTDSKIHSVRSAYFTGYGLEMLNFIAEGQTFHAKMSKVMQGKWRTDDYFIKVDDFITNTTINSETDDPVLQVLYSWVLSDSLLLELGYSPSVYAQIIQHEQLDDLDKEFIVQTKQKLQQLYLVMKPNFFKARVAFTLGLVYLYLNDTKSAESIMFDAFYMLRTIQWHIPLLMTPLGLNVCIQLMNIFTLNNKSTYCQSLIDITFFLAPHTLGIDIPSVVNTIAEVASHIGEEIKAINIYKWLLQFYYQHERFNEFLCVVSVMAEIYISTGKYESAIQLLSLRFISKKRLDNSSMRTLPIYHKNLYRLAEIFLQVGDDKQIKDTLNFFETGDIVRSKETELHLILAKMFAKRGWNEDCMKILSSVRLSDFEIGTSQSRNGVENTIKVYVIAAECFSHSNNYHKSLSMIDAAINLCDSCDYRLLGSLFYKRGNTIRMILESGIQVYPSTLRDDESVKDFILTFIYGEQEKYNNSLQSIDSTQFESDSEVVQEALLSYQKANDIYLLLSNEDPSEYSFPSLINMKFFAGSSFMKEWGVVKIKTSSKRKIFTISAEDARKYAWDALKISTQLFDIWRIIPAYITMAEVQFLREKKQEAYAHLQLAVQTLLDIGQNIPPNYVKQLHDNVARIVRLMLLFGKNTVNSNFDIIDTYLMLQAAVMRMNRRKNEFVNFWELNFFHSKPSNDVDDISLDIDSIDETDLRRNLLERMCSKVKSNSETYESYATHVLSLYSQLLYSKILAIKLNIHRYTSSQITKVALVEANKNVIKDILHLIKDTRSSYSFTIPQLGSIQSPPSLNEILPIFPKQEKSMRSMTLKRSQTDFRISSYSNSFIILQLCGSLIFYRSSGEVCVCHLTISTPLKRSITTIAIQVTVKTSSMYYIITPTATVSQLMLAISNDYSEGPKLKKTAFGSLKITKGQCRLVIKKEKQWQNFEMGSLVCLSRTPKTSGMVNEDSTIMSLLNPKELMDSNFNGHLKDFPQHPFKLHIVHKRNQTKLQTLLVKQQTITLDVFLMKYFAYLIDKTRGEPCSNIQEVKNRMEETFAIVNMFKQKQVDHLIVSPVLNVIPWELLSIFKDCVRFFSFASLDRITKAKITTNFKAPPVGLLLKCNSDTQSEDIRKQALIQEINLALCFADDLPHRSSQTINPGFFSSPATKQLCNSYPQLFKTIEINSHQLYSEQLHDYMTTIDHHYIIVVSEADLLECSDLLYFIAQQTNFGIMCISKLKFRKLAESTIRLERKQIVTNAQKFILMKGVQTDLTGSTFNCSSLFNVAKPN
ncbi:Clu domain-containing protein [Entamoeba marina]